MSLAKIAKIAKAGKEFQSRIRNAIFPLSSLAILAILARDIPAPLPLRCDVMDWVPLHPTLIEMPA